MKYVIVVPDGMADRPLKELGGRTPLEVASKPNMDFLAGNGVSGLAKTFYRGLPYDSSIANMGILGYDPRKFFTGRSPLEAANLGVTLGEGDLSLRCNLVTIEEGRMKDFTAGHISSPEGHHLMKDVDGVLGEEGVEFYPGVSYRNLLVLRSSVKPSDRFISYPPHDIIGGDISKHWVKERSKSSSKTVGLLNHLIRESTEILADHPVNRRRVSEGKNPANSIWLWGAGHKPKMPLFQDRHHIRGSLVSAVDLLKGLGRVVGLEVLDVKGATGYIDTNYEGKADAAAKSLQTADLTYVHMESTDEAGHEGSIEHKIRAIEDIDKKVVGNLLDKVEGDYRMLLMPDHATPIKIRTHTKEPVPYVIYDTTKKAKGVGRFTEKEIREKTDKPPIESYKLMNKLIRA
jgi:2,3-bisphosphoglycerate-independent phosphoglycerate mutase